MPHQVFGMITVAGSLIAGFALTPIAEMDMSNAPEFLRVITLTGCLIVIVAACFTVYIACETIVAGTKVAYRDNKSVEDVWQAFLVMGNLAGFSMYFVNLAYFAFLCAAVSISWIKVLEYWSDETAQRRYGIMLSVIGGAIPLLGGVLVRNHIRASFSSIDAMSDKARKAQKAEVEAALTLALTLIPTLIMTLTLTLNLTLILTLTLTLTLIRTRKQN